MTRLHVLGSAGWVPTLQRQACSYLIEGRRGLVFLDAGTGLSRLHDPMFRLILERHRRALFLISSWQQDRICGLHYLPFFLSHMEVHLALPSARLARSAPEKLLARWGGEPFLPVPIKSWDRLFGRGFEIEIVEPGANEILGEEIVAAALPASRPVVGYRVRDVCYAVGAPVTESTAELARGAALLVHEAWWDSRGAEEAGDGAAGDHATAAAAGRLAREAEVQELLLAHLNPAYDPSRLEGLVMEAGMEFPRSFLAADMMCFPVRSPAAEEGDAAEAAGPAEVDESADAEAADPADTPAGEVEQIEQVDEVAELGDAVRGDDGTETSICAEVDEPTETAEEAGSARGVSAPPPPSSRSPEGGRGDGSERSPR
jgi:ribonuclease BN (tRNA processing enzyme)